MQEIKTDLQNGEKIDTGRMYAFTKMLPFSDKLLQQKLAAQEAMLLVKLT